MKSICVFCGSSPGARPEYSSAARALGEEIAGRGLELVYGGARVGLMGAVADAALERGGRVTGVIPEWYADTDIGHHGLSEVVRVGTMHERKAEMARRATGFVALPGGLGTLEEAFEMVTWAQLGLHTKPVGLLNVSGYFDPLLGFLDHAVGERFIRQEHRALLLVDDDPVRLLDGFGSTPAPSVGKWIDRR